MNNQDKINLILMVVGVIFRSKMTNTEITNEQIITNTGTFNGRWFVNQTLRGFDFTVNDGGTIIPLRILEQNPNKTDQFGNLKQNAVLARQGHQIAWVIRTDKNVFLGKVMDGKWEKNKPRATTTIIHNQSVPGAGTVTTNTAQDQYNETYEQYGDDWQAELPDIDPNDIPLYVTGV